MSTRENVRWQEVPHLTVFKSWSKKDQTVLPWFLLNCIWQFNCEISSANQKVNINFLIKKKSDRKSQHTKNYYDQSFLEEDHKHEGCKQTVLGRRNLERSLLSVLYTLFPPPIPSIHSTPQPTSSPWQLMVFTVVDNSRLLVLFHKYWFFVWYPLWMTSVSNGNRTFP